jgi:hypothetical protein
VLATVGVGAGGGGCDVVLSLPHAVSNIKKILPMAFVIRRQKRSSDEPRLHLINRLLQFFIHIPSECAKSTTIEKLNEGQLGADFFGY